MSDDQNIRRAKSRLVQYWDYLEVPKLLSLQSPFPAGFDGEKPTVYDPDFDVRGDVTEAARAPGALPPLSADELFFISVHQSFEIWFKVCLTSLGIARDHFLAAADDHRDEDHLTRAIHHLDRIAPVLRMLAGQIEILATLPGREFLRMRTRLGTSSGFESYQFRLLEHQMGILALPDDFVVSPPQRRGIVAFIAAYRQALAHAEGTEPAILTKVGADLYHGTALDGLATEAASVAQRRREIDHIEHTIRAGHERITLKDAWFVWLARRLPHVTSPGDVSSVVLLGVLGGVNLHAPIRDLDLTLPIVVRRERVLRQLAVAHPFEEWLRAGHDGMRTAWTVRADDPLHAFAADVRLRQLKVWDDEIRLVLEGADLATESPEPPTEELISVSQRFPVVDRVLRTWLQQPGRSDAALGSDDSFLSLADMRREIEGQRLYGRIPEVVYEAIQGVFPAIAQRDPESLTGPDLIRAVEQFNSAAQRGSFVREGTDLTELFWKTIVGALRTPLSAAIEPCAVGPRRGVRCRYALLYFSRAERVRHLVEDPTCVEFPDRDLSADAARSAHAVGGLARRCLDRLLDLDEALANWRAHHVAVIARILGTRKGTAGTGTEYLTQSLGPRGMPEIVDGLGRVERPSDVATATRS